jgi:DNA polymerase
VLLLGEAPGHSEDVVGQPFKGLAGHLLDQITKEVFADSGLTLCHANLVGCIPLGDDRRKLKQPSHESIAACAPRLDDFISICRPRMVVRLGVLAHKHVADGDYVMCDLVHPAHIIRKTTIQQHYDKKKCVIALTNAIAKL